MIRHWLGRDTTGSTTVEFAIVGWMLCMVTFAIVETGLLWWTKSGMEITATMTARCGAAGYAYGTNATANFYCTSNSTTQTFATNSLTSYGMFPKMVNATNVTVNGRVTTCNGFTGNFFSVSLSSGFFSFLPPPLGNYTSLTASACYPMP